MRDWMVGRSGDDDLAQNLTEEVNRSSNSDRSVGYMSMTGKEILND